MNQEQLNTKAAETFADVTVQDLIEKGVAPEIARGERPAMVAAFLSLVADGAILVAEDGIVLIPSRVRA